MTATTEPRYMRYIYTYVSIAYIQYIIVNTYYRYIDAYCRAQYKVRSNKNTEIILCYALMASLDPFIEGGGELHTLPMYIYIYTPITTCFT